MLTAVHHRRLDPSRPLPLAEHVWIMIETALACQPSTTQPEQTPPLISALCEAMDLVGAGIPAVTPRAASPAKPHMANRDRASSNDPDRAALRPLPMNPVQHHHASGGHRAPSANFDGDYWRHQHDRVHDHWDRCEVIRRAARHLASLLRPDPAEVAEAVKRSKMGRDPSTEDQVLVNGRGWPPADVARRYHLTNRDVVLIRLNAKQPRHPLTGEHWTAPEPNALAAETARHFRDEGMLSVDIAIALDRNVNTIRAWTTLQRRAA